MQMERLEINLLFLHAEVNSEEWDFEEEQEKVEVADALVLGLVCIHMVRWSM
jgi:hypothetical protein